MGCAASAVDRPKPNSVTRPPNSAAATSQPSAATAAAAAGGRSKQQPKTPALQIANLTALDQSNGAPLSPVVPSHSASGQPRPSVSQPVQTYRSMVIHSSRVGQNVTPADTDERTNHDQTTGSTPSPINAAAILKPSSTTSPTTPNLGRPRNSYHAPQSPTTKPSAISTTTGASGTSPNKPKLEGKEHSPGRTPTTVAAMGGGGGANGSPNEKGLLGARSSSSFRMIKTAAPPRSASGTSLLPNIATAATKPSSSSRASLPSPVVTNLEDPAASVSTSGQQAPWLQSPSPTGGAGAAATSSGVRSLRSSKLNRSMRSGSNGPSSTADQRSPQHSHPHTMPGPAASGSASPQERSLLSPHGSAAAEKSLIHSQVGLGSGYGNSFLAAEGLSLHQHYEPSTYLGGERSQILHEQVEEIINRRHPPRMKGSKMLSEDGRRGSGRISPSLSGGLGGGHELEEEDAEMSHTHTYTYHTLISHTRAGIEAEEERLRDHARELAEQERERALRKKFPAGLLGVAKPSAGEDLYDKSQVINTSAYGYTHHTTRTNYNAPSVLHSYAAGYHRADSPLLMVDPDADLDPTGEMIDDEPPVDPYPLEVEIDAGDTGEYSKPVGGGRGRVSITGSTPLPLEEKEYGYMGYSMDDSVLGVMSTTSGGGGGTVPTSPIAHPPLKSGTIDSPSPTTPTVGTAASTTTTSPSPVAGTNLTRNLTIHASPPLLASAAASSGTQGSLTKSPLPLRGSHSTSLTKGSRSNSDATVGPQPTIPISVT